MPQIFWLVFCKGQAVGGGWGGECVWRGVPAISENSPRGGPQGAALRNKNSMCGTRCVCVCQCVLSLRPSPEKRSSQFEQRCRMTPVFNDKNAVITMTNNGSAHRSWNGWNWRLQFTHECLHYPDHIISTPPKHPLRRLSSRSSPCPLFSSLLALVRGPMLVWQTPSSYQLPSFLFSPPDYKNCSTTNEVFSSVCECRSLYIRVYSAL